MGSVNPLIPKPGTAYQWLPMEDPAVTDRKIKRLRSLMAGLESVVVGARDAPVPTRARLRDVQRVERDSERSGCGMLTRVVRCTRRHGSSGLGRIPDVQSVADVFRASHVTAGFRGIRARATLRA